MGTATIYMTNGDEYEVDYDSMEQNYTTVIFNSDDGTTNVFSKFNMICMVIKEKDHE